MSSLVTNKTLEILYTFLAFAFVALDDLQSAIKVATCKLGLQPGAAFQARVAQFAELVKAHKLVRVVDKQTNKPKKKIKIKRVVRSQSCDNDVDEDDLYPAISDMLSYFFKAGFE